MYINLSFTDQEVCRLSYNHMMNWSPFNGFFMGIIGLIIVIVIAHFIYKLVKGEKIFVPDEPSSESAEDILAERYINEELTREQYMQMKEDITGEKILVPNKPSTEGAEDILARRYVKGEITRERYLQMREDIKKPKEL